MLNELQISNFILVEYIKINFNDKLTVLSGETGAGKSVLVGAVNLVLGGQVRGDIFLDKTKSVVLEAVFSYQKQNRDLADLIKKYEIDISDGELFFRREIKPDGKSVIFINGIKSINSIVKEFREVLLDFHSQRDQHMLFNEDIQLEYLDDYTELNELKNEFSALYNKWSNLLNEAKKQKENIKRLQDKKLLFEYQINELEAAKLTINEEQELDKEYQILLNAKDILETFNTMNTVFFESENTLFDQINFYKNKLSKFKNNNVTIDNILENLNVCVSALEDINQSSRFIDQEIIIDEQRLIEVENRIKVLFDLKTKYKKDIPHLIDHITEMRTFIRNFNQHVKVNEDIDTEIKTISQNCIKIALELSVKRNQAAKIFEEEITNNLKELAIKDARFKILVDKNSDLNINCADISVLNSYGCDKVSYLFSANKGMPLQDIKLAISGGELSRLLLVIKGILANKLSEKTIIFDEIDTGIGGKTANMLGKYIKNLSNNQQIICITHLPQIAALGHNHYKIEKISVIDKNCITISQLDQNTRVNEIARMLSGNITELSLNHAKELLELNI